MLTKTNKLFPYFETDDKEQEELVSLYNDWYKDTAFRSYLSPSNQYWDALKEYCINHKEMVVDFWLQIYEKYGEVGHFTYMLDLVFPNTIEVVGHCTLSDIEKAWQLSLLIENGEIENVNKS